MPGRSSIARESVLFSVESRTREQKIADRIAHRATRALVDGREESYEVRGSLLGVTATAHSVEIYEKVVRHLRGEGVTAEAHRFTEPVFNRVGGRFLARPVQCDRIIAVSRNNMPLDVHPLEMPNHEAQIYPPPASLE